MHIQRLKEQRGVRKHVPVASLGKEKLSATTLFVGALGRGLNILPGVVRKGCFGGIEPPGEEDAAESVRLDSVVKLLGGVPAGADDWARVEN
jgi:hypothetical protein